MPACEKKQPGGCCSPCDKGETTFDAEFSIPLGFFNIDFLSNYDICEPQSKQMQTKVNLIYHQV